MQKKDCSCPKNKVVRKIPGKISDRQRRDWRWQIENRITDISQIADLWRLTPKQQTTLTAITAFYPFCVTPYYLSLCDPNDARDPIRRQFMPDRRELLDKNKPADPLGEKYYSSVPGLIHRYRNRVVVIITTDCAVRCRYCTRKNTLASFAADPASGNLKKAGPDGRLNGRNTAEPCLERGPALPRDSGRMPDLIFQRLPAIIKYIRQNTQIREVIISGGDPLLLETAALDKIMGELTAIKNVAVLRIGTRAPVVLPMRIDTELCACLASHRPLWINTQFNHPREITTESKNACRRLQEAGLPVSNQTVLLRGINNFPAVLEKLFNELQRMMVRPYYVFQCDPVRGVKHFVTLKSEGAELSMDLRGKLGGLSMPLFVVDIPGRKSKVPLSKNGAGLN